MVTITGKFDGKQILLDQMPKDIPANTRVRVVFETEKVQGLEAIVGMASDLELPPDFAAQHEHYTKGTPKR